MVRLVEGEEVIITDTYEGRALTHALFIARKQCRQCGTSLVGESAVSEFAALANARELTSKHMFTRHRTILKIRLEQPLLPEELVT